MSSLPVINYQNKDRETLIREVVHSMETLGFMLLENVPGFDEDELRWCVDFFFNLPMQKRLEVAKKKYNPDSKQVRLHCSHIYYGVIWKQLASFFFYVPLKQMCTTLSLITSLLICLITIEDSQLFVFFTPALIMASYFIASLLHL